MVNLSVLNKLQLGERLRCRHGRFFQLYHRRDGRFTLTMPETLLRWWDGSSRHSDFRAVLDVYNAGMVEIAHLRREDGEVAKATERQLLQRMTDSLRGLRVLERTYAEDVTLVSRIQRLRERVRLCCGVEDPAVAHHRDEPHAHAHASWKVDAAIFPMAALERRVAAALLERLPRVVLEGGIDARNLRVQRACHRHGHLHVHAVSHEYQPPPAHALQKWASTNW